MRWFKKAAGAVNTHYDVATELVVALNPSIRRVRKLEQRGTLANGVITGIHFSLSDQTTRKEYAIAVQDAAGAWQRLGVRTQPIESHRLRLGVSVVVKVDSDRGILDWEAMAAAWGLTSQVLAQESIRRPPTDGIVDTSIDARVQSRLKKWDRVEATIESLQRRTTMGMPTSNWDLRLRLADGQTALSKGDEVPSYAQWYAAPGTVVPAVIDPKDASKASIDWPAFALAEFDNAGFDDDPPTGSIAAEVEASRGAGATSAMGAGVGAPASDPTAPADIDATMRSWVDAYRGGHMKQKEFDRTLDDWMAAGMCTQAQVDAARAAAAS